MLSVQCGPVARTSYTDSTLGVGLCQLVILPVLQIGGRSVRLKWFSRADHIKRRQVGETMLSCKKWPSGKMGF
jgi:hypothetical protein